MISAVGSPVDRRDGPAKVAGEARFAAEYPFPGLAHAALVHATVARARITDIRTERAEAVDGVIAVITHRNAPAMKPPPKQQRMTDLSTLFSPTTVNVLNTDEVHWNGQPVAVVVAETLDAAREAAALVEISYAELPATTDFAAEEPNATPQKGNMLLPTNAKKGDAEAALARAAVSVDERYSTPPLHHNAMEPHATTAVWDGDRVTVHDSTQSIQYCRRHLAMRFDVPLANVRVIAPYVGGGFGAKGSIWPGTVLTVLAARATGRPVRLMLTREGVYRTVGGRTPSTQRVALGADADGRLTTLIHTSVSAVGRTGGNDEPIVAASRHLYDVPNILLRQDVVELDQTPPTFMRAPGEAIGTFALETAVDELAAGLGLDPIELRMRNEPAADPVSGARFAHRMLREAYALGAERFGWPARPPRPGAVRDGRWLVGMGVATAYHPAVMLPANVTVRLSADGTVLVRCGFQEMGMGGATAQAQIAADALGVPLEAVRVEYGDSELPNAPQAGGSVQTASVAASLLEACERIRRSALRLARRANGSPLRGRRPEQVVARNGGLYLADRPDTGETYVTLLTRAGRAHVEAAVGSDDGIGAVAGQVRFMTRFIRDSRRFVRAATGAQFCEVRVDADTGEVRVSRWLGVFDIGRVVNPKLVGSQLRGGIVMGIGMALSEGTLVDPRTGRIMNASLGGYHVPAHADIPPIDVHCLDDPDPTMPLGVVGAGEVSITGVAAAVSNAVYNATGRRVRDLPITMDKLL
ncbi:xanthine dehydrogenase family protein molybdopterin-binding subunit [Thermopolyspora sp. NPDC052614]|uniref:xanthine dehydrogenase family protein molybdopterin-binding subunit n=1 Tax=Thermopolyspora sp. NPDC052614 TaxID=3155682 RepID=UPI00341A8095